MSTDMAGASLLSYRPMSQVLLVILVKIMIMMIRIFDKTRQKPAYGRQGLDWIVRPGYSSNHDTTMETN